MGNAYIQKNAPKYSRWEIPVCSIATFAEAKLVLICKKQYTDMLKPEGFLIPETYQRWYNADPLHKLFVGEILAAYERMDAWADGLQNL